MENSTNPEAEGGAPEAVPGEPVRATLLGCLGIACVATLPCVLFLPWQTWQAPRWVTQVLPLLALTVLAVGAVLLTRVPSTRDRGAPASATAGREMFLRERPATLANRLLLLATGAALGVAAAGYVLADLSVGGTQQETVGLLLTSGGGLVVLLLGIAVGLGRVPPPAWGWVRERVAHPGQRHAVPLVMVGGVVLLWGLLLAFLGGYAWGQLGAGLLVIIIALLAPVAFRLPTRQDTRRSVPPRSRTRGG